MTKSSYIPANLRRKVIGRAKEKYEYCLKPKISFYSFEIDHIIAQKHGGKTELSNLTCSCINCNRYKGSDLASIDPETGNIVALFNPRTQNWSDHFKSQNGIIIPLSATGRVTVFLLHFNDTIFINQRLLYSDYYE